MDLDFKCKEVVVSPDDAREISVSASDVCDTDVFDCIDIKDFVDYQFNEIVDEISIKDYIEAVGLSELFGYIDTNELKEIISELFTIKELEEIISKM